MFSLRLFFSLGFRFWPLGFRFWQQSESGAARAKNNYLILKIWALIDFVFFAHFDGLIIDLLLT